jgi:RNAse R (EC 3.1.-.-)
MERRAIDAERDTDAMKKAEYMADHVGEEFDAVVSSVTKFGMFVSLQNTVEGLIHISEMKDDYYEYLEKQMALVGRHTKRTYRIGQPIKVKVINVNVDQKEIDFTLLNPENTPKTDLLKNNGGFKRNERGGKNKHMATSVIVSPRAITVNIKNFMEIVRLRTSSNGISSCRQWE